jgi:hypothetical protein
MNRLSAAITTLSRTRPTPALVPALLAAGLRTRAVSGLASARQVLTGTITQDPGPHHQGLRDAVRAAAAFHAWTGDYAVTTSLSPALRDATLRLAASPHTALAAAVVARVAHALEDVQDHKGAAAVRAALRTVAEEGRDLGSSAPPSKPDVGGFDAPGHAFESPDPAGPDDVPAAALFVERYVGGLFGVDPDAARHRVSVSPRLPPDFARLELTGLRVADAELDLAVDHAGQSVRYHLVQNAGAVPLRAVLTCRVHASPGRILVDGRDAGLDVAQEGGVWTIPVQVDLDAARVVEVELERF